MDNPLVSIRCLVYNHEPYLRQCLDGFVMQKTDFPFEAIVHDDASTDGSAAIIREYAGKYPDIIKPIFETENQYSKHDGSLARVMDAAIHPDSKYVAWCEGDDYWIDPYKLKKQVDVMESNPEIGLVYTCASQFDQEKQCLVVDSFGKAIDSYEAELINNECITLTTCVRKELLLSYREFYNCNQLWKRGWRTGDYPLWLYVCHYSKPFFIPEVTGVYRLLKYSASHSPDIGFKVNFQLSVLDIQEFFADVYHFEHIKTEMAINKMNQIQWFSVAHNQPPTYSLRELEKKYEIKLPTKIWIKHFLLKHRITRSAFIRLIKMKNRG